MRKFLFVAIVGIVVSLILASCAAPAAKSTQNLSIIMGEGEVVGKHGEEQKGTQESGAEEEAILGEFHRWEPATLVVHKGDEVVLTATNPRGNAHSFTLPEFGVVTPRLEPRGGTATVEFTADKAGVFQYACAVPYDEELGNCALDHERQVGYLIVLER